MNRFHYRAILVLAAGLALMPAARAQNLPHLAYVYPAGGRQGTTFQVKVGGQFLTSASQVVVSGRGVQATAIDSARPLSNKDYLLLRDQLKALQAKWQAAQKKAASWQPRRPQAGFGAGAAGQGLGNGPGKLNRQEKRNALGKWKRNGNAAINPGVKNPNGKDSGKRVALVARETRQARKAARRGGAALVAQAASPQPTPFAEATPAPPAGAWTAEDERTLAEIIKKLANPPNRQGNPAMAETVTLQVTIAPDAEPGVRELRLVQMSGLSNPLVFQVGQLPEFGESEEPNPGAVESVPELKALLKALPKKKSSAGQTGVSAAEVDAVLNVTLPATVNGRIMPGDVDRFRFTARKGQRLVAVVSARELIPYLADAVPGWFQATLALYDARGKEVAYNDDFRFNPDPVIAYQIPQDGEYQIEIKDAIYRGREDFIYRIALGELPFVTNIFPLGGRVGTQTTVEMKGWNLPVARLAPAAPAPGTYLLSERKGELVSNGAPFAVDTLPECLEKEGNNTAKDAQPLTPPVIVNGRVGKPGDVDVFRFEGRAGSRIIAEVDARRLGSPLDSLLRLTDAKGKQLALNDDFTDKGAGLTTHHADSLLSATLPADGTYTLRLGDAQHKGGADYAYRLRLSLPRPDFDLRVVPSSLTVRGGATIPLTVVALRRDGFNGDIALDLKNAPAGFILGGGRVPAGQDQVRVTLTAPPIPQPEPVSLVMEGRASIQGHEVVKQAVPAEDMMQAFFYRHLVPEKEMRVAVEKRYMSKAVVRVASPLPVKIPAGGSARVQIAAPRGGINNKLQLELSEPPVGMSIKGVTPMRGGVEVEVAADAKVKPGLKGNLIVQAYAPPPAQSATPKKNQSNARRTPQATLPAIPFDVVTPGM